MSGTVCRASACAGDVAETCGGTNACPPDANPDIDFDGTPNCSDGCPSDPGKIAVGQCGCGIADTDSDGDGTANCNDACPNNAPKIAAGQCGCAVADTDSDSDTIADCVDGCPFDASLTTKCERKRLTIDPTQVDADLTDFPVLVRITDPTLSIARVDGLDLFFSANGGPTALAFEIERWVQSTGELVAWVKLPLVANLTNTVFYLRYGDGSSTNKSNPTAVWSNGFQAVYHMNYGGGAGTQSDSTANANNASPDTYTGGGCTATAAQPVNQASGIVGKALTFGGDSCDRLVASDSNSLDITTELTISAWVRVTGTNAAGVLDVVSKRIRTTETANYQAQLFSDRNMGFMWGTGNMWPPIYNSSPAAIPALNTWAYTVWTVQGSPKAMRTYLNGTRINSTDQNLSSNIGGSYPVNTQLQLNANTQPLFIGGMDQETDEVFVGDLDEVRIASTSRSLAWVAAENNNQKSGSTFLTVTTE
jgi:hypothetical protein